MALQEPGNEASNNDMHFKQELGRTKFPPQSPLSKASADRIYELATQRKDSLGVKALYLIEHAASISVDSITRDHDDIQRFERDEAANVSKRKGWLDRLFSPDVDSQRKSLEKTLLKLPEFLDLIETLSAEHPSDPLLNEARRNLQRCLDAAEGREAPVAAVIPLSRDGETTMAEPIAKTDTEKANQAPWNSQLAEAMAAAANEDGHEVDHWLNGRLQRADDTATVIAGETPASFTQPEKPPAATRVAAFALPIIGTFGRAKDRKLARQHMREAMQEAEDEAKGSKIRDVLHAVRGDIIPNEDESPLPAAADRAIPADAFRETREMYPGVAFARPAEEGPNALDYYPSELPSTLVGPEHHDLAERWRHANGLPTLPVTLKTEHRDHLPDIVRPKAELDVAERGRLSLEAAAVEEATVVVPAEPIHVSAGHRMTDPSHRLAHPFFVEPYGQMHAQFPTPKVSTYRAEEPVTVETVVEEVPVTPVSAIARIPVEHPPLRSRLFLNHQPKMRWPITETYDPAPDDDFEIPNPMALREAKLSQRIDTDNQINDGDLFGEAPLELTERVDPLSGIPFSPDEEPAAQPGDRAPHDDAKEKIRGIAQSPHLTSEGKVAAYFDVLRHATTPETSHVAKAAAGSRGLANRLLSTQTIADLYRRLGGMEGTARDAALRSLHQVTQINPLHVALTRLEQEQQPTDVHHDTIHGVTHAIESLDDALGAAGLPEQLVEDVFQEITGRLKPCGLQHTNGRFQPITPDVEAVHERFKANLAKTADLHRS